MVNITGAVLGAILTVVGVVIVQIFYNTFSSNLGQARDLVATFGLILAAGGVFAILMSVLRV